MVGIICFRVLEFVFFISLSSIVIALFSILPVLLNPSTS